MKNEISPRKLPSAKDSRRHSEWLWLLMAGCVVALLIALFLPRRPKDSSSATDPAGKTARAGETGVVPGRRAGGLARRFRSSPPPSAEEIVAGKVSQFGRSRRDLARAIARRANKEVPAEVEKFFDAVESGRWEDIKTQWDELAKRSGQYEHSEHSADLDLFWPAVLDAYGVAEQAHLWPAQKLLDYGNAILDSLQPGMVYVGGTDNGRWIPELLNDTSDGERHVIVTQNALADARYLDFVSELYGDRLTTLTHDDSQRAFQEYTADAQKRFDHDQQFPDEPKQVRPGEGIQVVDGKVQVSGQVSVMEINEKLLGMLMDKNPDLSFGLQESFPFKGTYADALPAGPLMELRAPDSQNAFTAERATQSLDYWRNMAQQVLSDPEAAGSEAALKSYSHDTDATGNLLAAHGFSAEAEAAYRLASQLWPGGPESVGNLADLLARNGRESEARQLLEEFDRQYP
ncbi:MAG TPA: hypothetical protein VH598_16205, partial [Verrucomicrobiae bacterium]|nr:hypothetical protein [Verrucomicrobiae bacterium]